MGTGRFQLIVKVLIHSPLPLASGATNLTMHYGIHSASEIFQLEISRIIKGIDGVANSQDDIIIWTDKKEAHDACVKQVLTCIRESGLKLNRARCVFGVTELTFLGHIHLAEGVKPDPKKAEAITDMPTPSKKT